MNLRLFIGLWLAVSTFAHAAPITPDAFAHRAAIKVPDHGPFHQFALPLPLYLGLMRTDLGDLRVFNAHGEVVPHALIRFEASQAARLERIPSPVFPVNSIEKSPGELTVEVRRNRDDTLVALRQSSSENTGALVHGAVIDVSRTPFRQIRSLHLLMAQAATPFHPFTLETSDDLQHWRLLRSDAQIVQLEHAGQRVDNNAVSWDGGADKYLRLLWANPAQAPAIMGAAVEASHTTHREAPTLWTGPVAPSVVAGSDYDFVLPGRIPLERLRIALPQPNSLAAVSIELPYERASRRKRTDGWTNIASAVVYRLSSPKGEVRSPDIVLNRAAEQRLRLSVDPRGGGLGAQPPGIELGFVPHMLVFLARGEGPFSLAWGSPKVPNAALAAGTLIPGYRAGQAIRASTATLEMASLAPAAAARALPPKAAGLSKGVLWGILVFGVLVLGGMATMLVKQMKSSDEPLP